MAKGGQLVFITALGSGSVFGELALLTKERRNATVISQMYTDVLALKKGDFDAVMLEYPAFFAAMQRTVRDKQTGWGKVRAMLKVARVAQTFGGNVDYLRMFGLEDDKKVVADLRENMHKFPKDFASKLNLGLKIATLADPHSSNMHRVKTSKDVSEFAAMLAPSELQGQQDATKGENYQDLYRSRKVFADFVHRNTIKKRNTARNVRKMQENLGEGGKGTTLAHLPDD